jgi:DNA-directed RNA polymerase subunit beta
MKNQKLFVNNIGDLSEAQRASFYHFLSSGISEEISNFPNPFITNVRISPRKKTPCLVYLYPNEMKLKGPLNTPDMCFQSDLSYTLKIYISGEYSYPVNHKKQKEPAKALLALKFNRRLRIQQTRVKQDIFLGEIPLMTEEGTFIINGCERIVISQIIRSPGVYFRKELGAARTTIYTATIISNKGLWTKMVYDTCTLEEDPSKERSRIYMKLNDYRRNGNLNRCEKRKCNDANKLFFGDLLMYFGLTFQEVYDSLEHPIHLETLEFQFDESAFLMESLYLNQGSGCFSIGEIGRYKLNKKFGFHFSKDITYLTAHDFLKILDGLIELKYYNRVGDDIDDIKNKLIRSVGELLQNQLRIGFYRLQKNLSVNSPVPNSKKMSFDLEVLADPEPWILDPRPLTNSIRDFFKTSQLSQYMDQINPLAELTHKRRISVFGPNGLKRDHISTVIRDIHPSQYGRLCPVETPEGQNAGLIASVAMYARIGLLGSLETPYFFMKDATVYSSKHPIYLNPDQESETKVAFCDFSIDPIEKKLTPFLSVKENYFFSVQEAKEIHFLTTSPVQIISLATSLIPFIEHDDANRALMGSNMQRQAVPLLYTQKPIVGTGFESVAILDSGMVIKNYSQGKVEFSSSYSIQVKDPFHQTITYFLKKYTRSNQETCLNQRPLVWIGESVFSGQVIADGPATNDGELALGRNLTLAYMPWEGYNYEDAIVISERVLVDDCLTSVHIEEYETNITYYISKSEKITKRKLRHLTKYSRRLLNKHGIVRLGSYVREGDVLVGKLAPSAD